MSGKSLLLIAPLLLFSIGSLRAQETEPEENPFLPQTRVNQRSMGDQVFSINVGLYMPLFTVLLQDWPVQKSNKGVYTTNLKVGGTGSLMYGFYVSPHWKLSIQLTGAFAQDINGNFAYLIPITVRGTYVFHPGRRITIPLFLGAGVSLTTWKEDNFMADIILRPGFGVYFDWNYEWSFGLEISYWLIPQMGAANSYEHSIGNMMDISLSTEYHF